MLFAVFIIADDTDENIDFEGEYNDDERNHHHHDDEEEEPISEEPLPALPRTVRFIRDSIPSICPITIKHNYMVTFSYTAHLITEDNRVGTLFDSTPEYSTITLQANPRQMMTALYRGLLGACMDEKRSVIIPHEIANLSDPSLPKKTDFVFIVNVIDISPTVDYFDQIDIDRNGCLTKDEFKTYITEQRKTAPYLIDSAAEKLMALHDKDNDGYVECGEFQSANKHCLNIICVPVARRRAEEARLARLEAERLAKEAEEKRLREEKERKEREEQERKEREEKERKEREEKERLVREEKERIAAAEAAAAEAAAIAAAAAAAADGNDATDISE